MTAGGTSGAPAAKTLRALEQRLSVYGGTAAAEKLQLLAALGAARFAKASELLALQRMVSFLRAFPDNLAVHRASRRLATGFGSRVARLPKTERERLDDSGAAGTLTRHTYVAAAARWMQRRFTGAVDIDWKADNAAEALASLIAPRLEPMEAESVDLSKAGLRRWLKQATGGRGSDLAWLLAQAGSGAAMREFDRAFDAAEVPLAWRLDDLAGITGNALRGPLVPRAGGMRRASGDARAAIRQPIEVEALSRRAAARLLDVWRAALWSRTRSVLQIEQPNLDECYLADFGGGLQFAAIGVSPARRNLLEATYGHLLLANGMPIGYGGFTTLFAQVNTGINVFPEFRGSEAAFAFEQALRVMHTLTGNVRFVVNPYQFGAGNDEALASGAYWFYYRLGFRSADAAVRALAQRQYARLRAERGYRVPVVTLRRLAACDIYLDLADEAGSKFFDESWLEQLGAGMTAAIAGEGVANRKEAVARLSRRVSGVLGVHLADWAPIERQGMMQFAPLLAQIDDLADWPKADRSALARLVRMRWAVQERDFIAATTANDRLRTSLSKAARRAAAQP